MQGSSTETPQQPIFQRENLHQPLTGSSYDPAVSEDTLSVKPSLPPQIHLFKSQVVLNPTISKVNFVAYLLFSTYLTLIVLPAGLLTLPLLKIVYGLSESGAINAAAISQVCLLVYKFPVYPIFGALCDKYGRKPFIIAGVILINAAILLTPGLPGIYPFYILVAVMQDLGLTCMMIPPLLADYVDYATKGRVAGIAGVLSNLASFISTLITSKVDVTEHIPAEYHYIGLCGLVIGVIIIFGLKGGAYHKALFFDKTAEEAKQKAAEQLQEEKRRLSDYNGSAIRNGIGSGHQDFENIPVASHETNQAPQLTITENAAPATEQPGFKAGINEAKRNPWIFMGFLGNFLNIGIAVIINGSLVNYVPVVTGNEGDANQAYNLANKEVLASLISVFFFGYAVDKLDKLKVLISTIVLSMVAVVILLLAPSPFHFMAYLSMVCFGVAGAGIATFAGQALSKYPNPKYRASVGAIGGMFSMLGQIYIALIGMGLSQFDASIPFYLYFGACIVTLFVIMRVYIKKRDIMSKL